jgi:hypothetical protein
VAGICGAAALVYLAYACVGYVGKRDFYINGLPATAVLVFIGWMAAAAAGSLYGAQLRTGRTRLFRAALASLVPILVAMALALALPLLPQGVRIGDTSARQALMSLLPAEADQRQYRVAGPVDITTDWINSRYGVPQVWGYQEQGILHRDWQAYLEVSLQPERPAAERNYLFDWYGVKWLYAGPGVAIVKAYDRHPDLFQPIASTPAAKRFALA